MRVAIILALSISNLSFAADEELLAEYIQYGIELNNSKSMSSKDLIGCVYGTIYNVLDDQDKEYFRKTLAFKKNNPELPIKQVEAETKALYDPSGKYDKSFKEKVELAKPKYMSKCYKIE
jgi:hypothetical protein